MVDEVTTCKVRMKKSYVGKQTKQTNLSASKDGGPHTEGAVRDDGVVAGGEQGQVLPDIHPGCKGPEIYTFQSRP